MGRKSKPMVGERFGVLSVIDEAVDSNPRNKKYLVRCDRCGSEMILFGGNIRRGALTETGGCKCICPVQSGQFKYKHGLTHHPFYKVWDGMVSRCENIHHVHYANYGGRGITVCKEWRETPELFMGWLFKNGYRKGLTVDRENNELGYTPDNCRVVLPVVNANNRRNNRILELHSGVFTVSQAAREFGLKKTTIKERLNRGWGDEDAVRRPVHGC